MPARLKDRNVQIPGGFRFYVPQTKWQPHPFSSFETIVRGLIDHRRINHVFTRQHNWSLSYAAVCQEVDSYNAELCKKHGWLSYIHEDAGVPPPPKPRPRPLFQSARHVVAGADVLKDWLGAGGTPVAADLAARRAATCSSGAPGSTRCPHNSRGDWTRFFTIPASGMIRGMLSLRNDLSLSTPLDDELGVCTACDCPLKLKVWTPLTHIKAHTAADAMAAFPAFCWVRRELEGGAASENAAPP